MFQRRFMKGLFITFEGSEGSGKSTQARMLVGYLKTKGLPVLFIREPGGVKISEAIRKLLLDAKNKEMSDACETMLYMAARAQLVKEVIAPAIKTGKILICDRFLDSTIVYQGYGNGVDIKMIKLLGKFATGGISPDLTFIFDIPVKQGLSRTGKTKDRIERRPLGYHEKVRQGYLDLARREPERIKVICAQGTKLEIQEVVRKSIGGLIKI